MSFATLAPFVIGVGILLVLLLAWPACSKRSTARWTRAWP